MVNNEQEIVIDNDELDGNFLLVIFDVVFIMLLCFATLLSTMLMRGTVIVGSGSTAGLEYTFDITSFLITACTLGVYLVYIIKNSDKELYEIVNNIYDDENMA